MNARTPSQVGKANKAAGAKCELETRKALEAAGWLAVASKASLGPADVMALAPLTRIGSRLPMLIQCKTNGYLAPAARAELQALADRYGAWAVVAYWRKEGRSAREVRFKDLEGNEVKP